MTRVYQPLTGLTNARVDLMTSMVSFERVFEVLDAPEAITEKPGAFDLIAPRGAVEFEDVTFRYPPAVDSAIASMEQNAGLGTGTDPDVDVLQRLSLSIAPGETVALVGASGAGKSTTISLLPRLYDVTSGVVARRWARRTRPHTRFAPGVDRRRRTRSAPLPRVDRREPALRRSISIGGRRRRSGQGSANSRHDRRVAGRLRHHCR